MSPEQSALAEEDAILRRLDQVSRFGKSCIGVVAQVRRDAAHRLAAKGLVVVREGAGLDEGTLLVSAAPPRGGPPGGQAA